MSKQTENVIAPIAKLRFAAYNRFGATGLKEELKMPDCSFGVSLVDRTNFRPSAENVRAQLLSPRGAGSSVVGLYDFLDGKDTGYTPVRDLSLDITEVQAKIDEIKAEAESTKRSQAEQAEVAKQMQQLSSAIHDAFVSPASAGDEN